VILEIDSEAIDASEGLENKGGWIALKKGLDSRFDRRGLADEWRKHKR
jgi:hypothetical protein